MNFIHTYDGLYQLASEAGVASRTYAQDSIGNRLLLNRGATAYTYNHLNELLLQNASTSVLTGTIRVPVSGLYGPTKLSEAVSSVTLKLDGGNALSATVYTNRTWDYMNAGLKGLNVPVDGATHTITVTATTTNHITNTKTVTVSYASTTITSYDFDRNGNLLQQIAHGSNAAVYSYAYDALNRLVYITKAHPTASVVRVHYGYDPFDRLISKAVSVTSVVQKFLWDDQNEIGSADHSNNLLQLRFLGPGLGHEVGAAIAVELRTNTAGAWVAYAPIHDHRGNVVVLLHRATGAVAEYYRYDAFGNAQIYSPAHSLLPNSALGNPWRFASKRADMETGFVYFGRRFYDPTAGRFVTADPLGFADGPNRYVYVGNSPLVFVDPDGRLAKGAGYGLKDLAVGTGQLFWNLGGSLGYGAVSIFDYEFAEIIYGEQAQGLRNFGHGMGSLAWNVGGGIGYAITWGIDTDYARDVYGEQAKGLQEAAISMSGGEGRSGYYRTGYVGSQIAAVYLLGKYGNQPIGAKSVTPSPTIANAGSEAAERALSDLLISKELR